MLSIYLNPAPIRFKNKVYISIRRGSEYPADRPPRTMFIPSFRLHGRDVNGGVASFGDGTSTADSQHPEKNRGPVDATPGVRRFIGVISVAVVILLVFSLWLARRKIRILFGGKSSSAIQEGDKNLDPVSAAPERIPTRNINNPPRMKRVTKGPR